MSNFLVQQRPYGNMPDLRTEDIPDYMYCLNTKGAMKRTLTTEDKAKIVEEFSGNINLFAKTMMGDLVDETDVCIYEKEIEEEEIKLDRIPENFWKSIATINKQQIVKAYDAEYMMCIGNQIVIRKITDDDRAMEASQIRYYDKDYYNWLYRSVYRRFDIEYRFIQLTGTEPRLITEGCDIETKQMNMRIPKNGRMKSDERMRDEVKAQPLYANGKRKYLIAHGEGFYVVKLLTEEETAVYDKQGKDAFFKLMKPYFIANNIYWPKWLVSEHRPVVYDLNETDSSAPDASEQLKKSDMYIKALLTDKCLNIRINNIVHRFVKEIYSLPQSLGGGVCYRQFVSELLYHIGGKAMSDKLLYAKAYKKSLYFEKV